MHIPNYHVHIGTLHVHNTKNSVICIRDAYLKCYLRKFQDFSVFLKSTILTCYLFFHFANAYADNSLLKEQEATYDFFNRQMSFEDMLSNTLFANKYNSDMLICSWYSRFQIFEARASGRIRGKITMLATPCGVE